jgi:hypothetical protein
LITATKFWYGFQSEGINATVGSETSTNLSEANFTEENLTGKILGGVIIDGVILCKTTMPDGTINKVGCKNQP